MRTLEFLVDKQLLRKAPGCDFSNIAPGTCGYLHAKFNFSSPEWDGCTKAASFWHNGQEHAVLLKDDACEIPAKALVGNVFRVSVTGAREKYRITTTRTTVRQGG